MRAERPVDLGLDRITLICCLNSALRSDLMRCSVVAHLRNEERTSSSKAVHAFVFVRTGTRSLYPMFSMGKLQAGQFVGPIHPLGFLRTTWQLKQT